MHDLVQPTIRALYAHDFEDLNGLAALLAMNPSAVYQINGRSRGNSELTYRLLHLSEAQLRKRGQSLQDPFSGTKSRLHHRGDVGEAPGTLPDAMDIRWIHNQVWPFASPSGTGATRSNNIELVNGLFFTGIGEVLEFFYYEVQQQMKVLKCENSTLYCEMVYHECRPLIQNY